MLPLQLQIMPPPIIVAPFLDQPSQGILLLPQSLGLFGDGLRRLSELINSGADVLLAHRLHLGQIMQLGKPVDMPAPVQSRVPSP